MVEMEREILRSISQRPNIIVYEDSKEEKVICTAEVRSSPMVVSERKATIGAAYLLRLLRYTDQDIKTITTFALPNMEEKQCVVQITLEWRDFRFVSNVKRHLNMPRNKMHYSGSMSTTSSTSLGRNGRRSHGTDT